MAVLEVIFSRGGTYVVQSAVTHVCAYMSVHVGCSWLDYGVGWGGGGWILWHLNQKSWC